MRSGAKGIGEKLRVGGRESRLIDLPAYAEIGVNTGSTPGQEIREG